MWEEIIYPFPNNDHVTIEVSEWIFAPLKFGMDKLFQPILYWAREYLSMLRLKLIHVSKRIYWVLPDVVGYGLGTVVFVVTVLFVVLSCHIHLI